MLRQQLFAGCLRIIYPDQLPQSVRNDYHNQSRQNAERHKILCKAEGALLVMTVSWFVTKPSHFPV